MGNKHWSGIAGKFRHDWWPLGHAAKNAVCPTCGWDDIAYRSWRAESGTLEDTRYRCERCKQEWWGIKPLR